MTDIVKKVLIGVRELLSDESHWTKMTEARTNKGKDVATENNCSYSRGLWSLARAIDKTHLNYSGRNSDKIIISFNDAYGRKHSEILEVLDLAIEQRD